MSRFGADALSRDRCVEEQWTPPSTPVALSAPPLEERRMAAMAPVEPRSGPARSKALRPG